MVMRFWTKSLTAKLASYFLLLALVPLSVVSYVAYNIGEETLRKDVLDHLSTTIILKEDEINRWIVDRKRSTQLLAQAPIVRQYSGLLLAESEADPEFLSAYEILGDYLAVVQAEEPDFLEVFILTDVGGKVVLSTNKGHEGEYNVTSTYFIEGRKATYVQNVYFSVPLDRTTMTIATPIEDETGQRVGVLGTHINLDKMDEIMLERGGLGATGETYLVDKYNVFVSEARLGERDFPRGVHTEGIDAALQGNDGTGLYENYRGVPVIGAYRWIEDCELALLAEMEQEEAFASVRRLAQVILLAGVMAAGLVLLIAYLSARQISRPVVAITEAATGIAAGDLSQRAPVLTRDEVGVLANAFNRMAAQLRELIENLEQRVAERTHEYEEAVVRTQQAYAQLYEAHQKLEVTTYQAQRRALQLETATEVSRAATSVLDPDRLVHQAVDLIRNRFDLYYAGLFLLDESERWAVLRAGTGEPGRQMLEAGHKLEVGGQSMVGWCTANARARVTFDVGEEAVRFDNPLLPETRSEMALPLISRGRVIGALDVQSVEAGAFSDEDITILQTMADQIAVAIDNARLFTESQTRLEEVQAAHRSYLRDSWDDFLPTKETTDYEYVQPGVRLFGDAVLPKVQQVMAQQRTVVLSGSGDSKEEPSPAQSALVAPITLRGQVIGALGLHEAEGTRQWTSDEIALVEAVADQMALAVENARLFEETRIRAEELAVLNELGQALTTHLNVEEVLSTTYWGASRLLDTANFYIGLYDPERDEISLVFDVTESAQDAEITVISADQGLAGYIVRNRTGVLLEEDVRERQEALGIEMIGKEPLSWLGVPLIVGDRVLGVMAVQNFTTPHAYDEHDRDLLTAIASQAAIALQNARLFKATQARARRERLIREITGKVQGSIDLDSILQTTVQELGKALGVSQAAVRLGTEAELSLPHQVEKRTMGTHQNDQRYGPGISAEQKEM
jgi:GAF domain-containing protein/HAMP domain-containing protein